MEKTKLNQLVQNAIHLKIDTNAMIADGEGVLRFPNGLVITDSSEMWSGTRYDIPTLDLSQYNKRMFADHEYGVKSIVGNMLNIYKQGDRVMTDGVRFAVNENPTARLVHDLIIGGFLDTVSVGTQGPFPEEDGIYRNHVVLEVSWVGLPNNKNASINDALPLMELAATHGLDLEKYKEKEERKGTEMSKVKISNSRNFAVKVSFKNDADAVEEKELQPGESVEVTEDQKEVVETQISSAVAPQSADVSTVASLVGELKSELADLKKFKADHSAENAQVPAFVSGGSEGTPVVSTVADKASAMSGKERTKRQAQLAFNRLSHTEEYQALNEVNKKELVSKKSEIEKITKNVITMDEDSFGGFIPCYELLSEIVGCRTSYDSLLNVFSFENSDNLQYAWNLRVGDIDMSPVEMCDDGEDGNRKPISEYGLNMETRSLEELAAVTPVCNAATLFAVGDILRDVAGGYQNSQKRNFARLVVAELQKAVDLAVAGKTEGGADIAANPDASIAASTTEEWEGILTSINEIIDCTPDGILVMSTASYSVLQAALIRAGLAGAGNTDLITADGARFNSYLGRRVVLTPNDLLPKLGTDQTRAFVINGTTVTIDHAIFYIDPANFRGITHNSGLQYDLSREAAYEVNTGTVESPTWVTRSAYQRNELVLRGSMFRGGGVKDFRQVTGILAETTES